MLAVGDITGRELTGVAWSNVNCRGGYIKFALPRPIKIGSENLIGSGVDVANTRSDAKKASKTLTAISKVLKIAVIEEVLTVEAC